jgi:hypothetical protein
MDQHENNKARELDRKWDRHLDGQPGKDADSEIIATIHQSDRTPGPSAEMRSRLEAGLRAQHPGAAYDMTDKAPNTADRAPDPATDHSSRGPIPLSEQPASRKWGELAAIVVILSLAIAGTVLYGDDAYDFAQQQIASNTDDTESVDSDTRAVLEEEGEVSGLTFEEAQSLTPMQLVLPDVLPEALSEPEFTAFTNALQTRKPDLVWPHWSAIATYDAGDGLPPVEIQFAPAWSLGSRGMPLPTDVGRHQDAPSGTFDVLSLGDSQVVRSIELTDEGEAISHFNWFQGDVAIKLAAPVETGLDEEQQSWIDMPDTTFSYEDIESMILAILDHGDLDDGSNHIANRDLDMGEVLNWTPTAPFPESVPEPLGLLRADAGPNGPTLYMEHPDDSILDIWLHSYVGLSTTMPGGSVQADIEETLSSAQIDAGGVPVTRTTFTDPSHPDVADFLLMTRNTDLLLPWMSGGGETSLVLYLWEIAGMNFVMGVEVDPAAVGSDDDDSSIDISGLRESDWMALIEEQSLVADEYLDPRELFPELAREATEAEEQLLTETDARAPMADQIEMIRLLGEQDNISFYVGVTSNQGICAITTVEVDGDESMGASGCNPIWHAADVGTGTYSGGVDQPAILAYVLPQGYDEVVDAEGEVIGLVENQLFAKVFESGENRPSDMIARGPAGELYLGLGTSGQSQREGPPAIDLP